MYQQRPVQGPPPGRYDNRYPPQAVDWHDQAAAQDVYYDQAYGAYGYDNQHYHYDNGGYDNAGYGYHDGYMNPASSGHPHAPLSPHRAGYGPPMEQPYDRGNAYGHGYGYDERRGYGNERPGPQNGAGNMRMDRPPANPRPSAQRQPSPVKLSWDNPFPAFPAKPKRKPSGPTGLETDMAAMNVNDAPPTMRSPEQPQARRPSIPRQQAGYRPAPGQPPVNGSARPVRSASERQRPVGPPPSDHAPYDHHPYGRPERSYTYASDHEPSPPVPHVNRSVTMPVSSAPSVTPPPGSPLYPGQHTYQEPVLSSPASFKAPVLPRPSTAGGFRPTMPRANVDANAPAQPFYNLPERISETPSQYEPHDVLDDYHEPAQAEEPEMPNFDAMPDVNNNGPAVDENLPGLEPSKPKTPAPPTGGQYTAFKPGFVAQAHRARSQPNLKSTTPNQFETAGFQFGLPNDVPPVPQVQRQASRGYGPSRPPNVYEEPMQAQYPQRHPSRGGPTMPPGSGYPGRGTPPQQYPPNGPPRPYRANQPGMVNTTEVAEPQQTPDAMRQHPVPFRPGLAQGGTAPPPVRQYSTHNSASPPPAAAQQGRPVDAQNSGPVTHEELQRIQQLAKSKPNDSKTQLLLAKKLAEAATVLVGDESRLDPKTRTKTREKYTMDAYKIVKRLVHGGYPEAQFYLADCYGQGALGLQVDAKEAFHLYHSAAKQGHAKSAYRVAVCCEIGYEEGGGTKRDPFKAVQWYKRAAALGDPPAMYKMGMILLKGLLGQARNPREGVSWLKRAADRADTENPHALHELALMYESAKPNDIIIRDEEYAKQLFHQAAELGYKFSQFRLGAAYEYGLMGCPVDPRQSIVWYSRAAAQGEHQSELALSGWYLTGTEGILQQSDTEAYLWARKAAAAGLPKAEYAMGYFTEVGIGTAANIDDAKRWYWRAAAQGYPKARERLEDLKKGGSRMQKTRLSRSAVNRQSEGDCVVM